MTITFLGEQQDIIDPEAAILVAGQKTKHQVLYNSSRSTNCRVPTRSPAWPSPNPASTASALHLDLSLKPNATFEQDLPPAYNGFFYVLDGSVQVGGDTIAASQVGWLAPSSSLELLISAQENGARLVLFGGQPLGEPMTQGGPFVAGTPSEIGDFNRHFGAGEFTRMSELATRLTGEVRAPMPTNR